MDKAKILIVEDEAIVAGDIKDSLETMGYAVCGAVSTGEEAVERVEADGPDLVMMDIVLKGGMDGVQAAETIGARFDVPVIFLTAHADSDLIHRVKRTKPFGYLLKPFDDKELQTIIELALYKAEVEKELKESEEHFRRLFEDAPLAYQSLNADGRLLQVNTTWLKVLGYRRPEVIGRPFADFVAPPDVSRFYESFEKFKAAGEMQGVQLDLKRKDGALLTVEFHGRVHMNERGFVEQTHCVFHDITTRKRAEEERKRLIDDLATALTEVKKLSGLLPICANCKKIRDDEGYWQQVEKYIQDRSEARFSHSICPECARKLYPELFEDN